HPGAQAPAVAGACVDGMDVVVLGPRLALADSDRRRLLARAREHGSVLISAGPWAGAHTTLTVEGSRWSGLGAGAGRLRERQLSVVIGSRASGQTRRVLLTLDSDPGLKRTRRESVGQAAFEGAA